MGRKVSVVIEATKDLAIRWFIILQLVCYYQKSCSPINKQLTGCMVMTPRELITGLKAVVIVKGG